ncbi:MAG TPA: hypothetical protein VEC36_13315 [Patescibacteria group bacterium]|nr:hypothetical protein [Patescibacteria group bacterium]
MKKLFFLLSFFFGAQAAFAIDAKIGLVADIGFKDKWYKIVPPAMPQILTVSKVFKGQNFVFVLFMNDYAVANNTPNVVYDLKIVAPTGSMYFEQKGLAALSQMLPNPNVILLSEAQLQISFEEKDAFGEYKIFVNVVDKIEGKEKKIEGKIELIDFKNTDGFKKEDELGPWMTMYYRNPSPEKLLDGFWLYTKSTFADNDNSFPALMNFFREGFENNTYLIPKLLAGYSEQNEKTKFFTLFLIRNLNFKADEFLKSLSENETAKWQKIVEDAALNPYAQISHPIQLDILWTSFFATGTTAPIEKLVSVLAFKEFEGAEATAESSDEQKEKFLKGLVYKSAKWSFESNTQQHSLVKDYLRYISLNPRLDKAILKEVAEILAEVK